VSAERNTLLKQYADAVVEVRGLEDAVIAQTKAAHAAAGEGDVPSWYGGYEIMPPFDGDVFALVSARQRLALLELQLAQEWLRIVGST
jgi:hypothetical protein